MSGKEVYLDSCKTSRLAPEVLNAMMPYLTGKYWYPGSFTSIGTEVAEVIEKAQETVANSLNAKPEEITFTSGEQMRITLRYKESYRQTKRRADILSAQLSHTHRFWRSFRDWRSRDSKGLISPQIRMDTLIWKSSKQRSDQTQFLLRSRM